jgi:hypothetical protein
MSFSRRFADDLRRVEVGNGHKMFSNLLNKEINAATALDLSGTLVVPRTGDEAGSVSVKKNSVVGAVAPVPGLPA